MQGKTRLNSEVLVSMRIIGTYWRYVSNVHLSLSSIFLKAWRVCWWLLGNQLDQSSFFANLSLMIDEEEMKRLSICSYGCSRDNWGRVRWMFFSEYIVHVSLTTSTNAKRRLVTLYFWRDLSAFARAHIAVDFQLRWTIPHHVNDHCAMKYKLIESEACMR
jgi:hypothetical protein